MKKSRIIIYGSGGQATVVYSILKDLNLGPLVYIDDNVGAGFFGGLQKINDVEILITDKLIVAIGKNKIRKIIVDRLNQYSFITVSHPSAYIHESCVIKEGSVIMQNSTIQINARVGRHCIINTGSCIDHDCIIEDYCHIAPNATLTGNVRVGEGTWIGAGSVVLPDVKIGKWSIVGAGSVVTRDVGDFEIVVGVPAKKINDIK